MIIRRSRRHLTVLKWVSQLLLSYVIWSDMIYVYRVCLEFFGFIKSLYLHVKTFDIWFKETQSKENSSRWERSHPCCWAHSASMKSQGHPWMQILGLWSCCTQIQVLSRYIKLPLNGNLVGIRTMGSSYVIQNLILFDLMNLIPKQIKISQKWIWSNVER